MRHEPRREQLAEEPLLGEQLPARVDVVVDESHDDQVERPVRHDLSGSPFPELREVVAGPAPEI
ncbi:hypothetical protein ACWC2T_18990 [Streptomyces sp. NPDC001393]